MRLMLDSVSMDGVVVIGEGEKDEAPMLYNGESVGDGTGPAVDVGNQTRQGTRRGGEGRGADALQRGVGGRWAGPRGRRPRRSARRHAPDSARPAECDRRDR